MELRRKEEEENKEDFEEIVQGSEDICICPSCGTKILNPETDCRNELCPNCGEHMNAP
jgi:predicted RNA-binding Zn-ribbon protein involved in translation (DUF1610 family)